jgi:hypothetical protein
MKTTCERNQDTLALTDLEFAKDLAEARALGKSMVEFSADRDPAVAAQLAACIARGVEYNRRDQTTALAIRIDKTGRFYMGISKTGRLETTHQLAHGKFYNQIERSTDDQAILTARKVKFTIIKLGIEL